ncbi:MAG: hypothetical protein GX660_05745 [Clostridiaceae bacterium]|nr:hypothetical protein [Clostridiaceae bacterium]
MKNRLRVISSVSFFAGTAAIFIAAYFEQIYSPGNIFNIGIIGDTIVAMLRGVGVALVTSVFVSVLKLWFESTDYLVKNNFIKFLSKEEMLNLKSEIESELYFSKNNHNKDNNFYSFFGREVSSLLNECFYSYYETTIECCINDDYISKTITKKFQIVNPSKKEVLEKIPFRAEMQKVSNIDNRDLYKIEKFEIDSLDFTGQINNELLIVDEGNESKDAYCVKVDAEYEVKVKKQTTIDMVIKTIVPIDDVCFSNKITKPCKEYEINFIVKNSPCKLSWHNFGFLGNHKDNIMETPIENGVILKLRDWILPGDGILVAINNNKKNSD